MRRRRSVLIVAVCIVLLVTASHLLLSQKAPSQYHLTLTLIGITNINGTTFATVGISNDGPRALETALSFCIQTLPSEPHPPGPPAPGIRIFKPGDAITNTIPIPPLSDRSWRTFVVYWKHRPNLSAIAHYWLMQAGLARREETGEVAYTGWVTNSDSESATNGN